MDDKTKVTAAIEKLKQLGFKYNQTAQNIIEECTSGTPTRRATSTPGRT